MANDQSSNLTGLYSAEEVDLGILPANPVFYEREPNSYSDFGGNYSMTTRRPIVHDRQHYKGDVSDDNPSGGWNEDLTPNNMLREMQAFLFADAREKPSTAPLNAAPVAITEVSATEYEAAAGLDVFAPGHLILASGFATPENNGLKEISAVAADAVAANGLVAELAPPAGARLDVVGFRFAEDALSISVTSSQVTLSAAGGLLALKLNLGEFIAVGGDTTESRFADTGNNAPFYGRVASISDTDIILDKTTGVQENSAGTGKKIEIFFGTFIRNEDDCTKIKRRSFTLERHYGCGPGQVQSTGIKGACANQVTITVPTPGEDAKVALDLEFIATSSFERTLSEGPVTADPGASVVKALNEPCFKPGIDVYSHKLAVIDPLTLNPTSLVAYNSEASLVINNNLAGNKAIEAFGFSGVNIGDFSVTGSLNAYFTGVEAVRAVREGADCTYHLILTKANAAVAFDIASLGLGNGRATVEANASVKLPLDTAAGKGKFGYSLAVSFLRYVPTVLMPQKRF